MSVGFVAASVEIHDWLDLARLLALGAVRLFCGLGMGHCSRIGTNSMGRVLHSPDLVV